MEKNYVLKSDLGEIMESIAERTLAHNDRMRVNMSVEKWLDENRLNVAIYTVNGSYQQLADRTYIIVDDIKHDVDVADETVGDALVMLERLEAEAARKQEKKVEPIEAEE